MLTQTEAGIILSVKVIPKASKEQIVGKEGEELKIKVTAPPEKGEANRAVIRLLAKHLELPQREIVLIYGETSRHKRFCITGKSLEEIRERLEEEH